MIKTRLIESKKIHIFELLIYCFVLVSSWSFLIPTTSLDEVFLILMVLVLFLKKKKINKRSLLIVALYSIWCIIGLMFNAKISFYSLIQLFNNLKPILLLICVVSFELKEDETKRIISAIEIVNIPSVIIGVINAVRYNYFHQDLLIESGTFKEINGVLTLRAGGLIGHSGIFSTLCASIFIIVLFKDINSLKKIFKLLFWAIGLYLGRGRVPLAVAILSILYYVWIHFSKKNKVIVGTIAALVTVLMAVNIYDYVLNEYAMDFKTQIRFIALRTVVSFLDRVSFFGFGVGNIGNEYSMTNNFDLYSKLDIVSYGRYDWESNLAISLLQTGVIGTLLWYFLFVYYFWISFKNNNTKKYLCTFIAFYFLANTFINKAYEPAFLIIVVVLISEQVYLRKTIKESIENV